MDENKEDKIDLSHLLDRVFKAMMHLKIGLLLIVIACIGFFELKTILFFNTVYSSQAVFILSTDSGSTYIQSDDNDEMLSTFNTVITGSMMQETLKKELDKDVINGTITTSQITDTNLVELKVTSPNAQDAYDIINCILNHYGQVTTMVMSDIHMAVLDTPKLATAPDALPDYLRSGIKGLLVGIVIDAVIIMLYTLLRRTINNNDDIKNILHLSNIAKIPYIPGSQKLNNKMSQLLITNPGVQYRFKKAFHDIRLRIERDHKKNDTKVIMVTSTLPNEGKSVTAANTAIALAQKDHSVLLVDLDLRNPSILHILQSIDMNGNMSDYLKGKYSLEEVINHCEDMPLDIIYGVKSIEEATELLSADQFDQFIALVKEQYDYVILDVPPLYLMEDTLIISKQCDSAIIVIKQDSSHAYDILEALEELNRYVPSIMGTVLTQVKPSLFDQEMGSYGYGYGYGYGRK